MLKNLLLLKEHMNNISISYAWYSINYSKFGICIKNSLFLLIYTRI